jgi:hypothetical protein
MRALYHIKGALCVASGSFHGSNKLNEETENMATSNASVPED